ncbi:MULTISPECIES: ornithine carbamoyltransferase [Enterococcus]|uniref:Ornithine carbamoyltransferase n=1 Tax=Enterococcus sulfureus ATCC 49903 TaxID=1140003 RepID=S0P3D6_9ENTE|nr:ornithine carbamoyltransferase [Enterococcus sulfureus]EOT45794.1 ornithine carbamoyltransferase [Enterococcus sulfureus ATCC 49903]EOT82941.1 ornithine carbamoyltransferase [Enterococcus sulfureus ATCC 49903]
MSHFQGKSFLKETDFTKNEWEYLIDFSLHLKKMKQEHLPHPYLQGKNIALLFEKTSTRTRSAFTVAANDLGAHPEFLGKSDIQFGKKESVTDTAKVLGSMFDGIEYRGFSQTIVEELAQASGVPVWNGLTDEWHPTQMLADFMTIKEHFGTLENLTLTYLGDGRNNVANSLLVTGAILGVNIHIAAPRELQPSQAVVALAKQFAAPNTTFLITENVEEAVLGADVLYTDVWISMGENVDVNKRLTQLLPYQVNQTCLEATKNERTIFLHCLPAFHDLETVEGKALAASLGIEALEVTDDVFLSERSLAFTQAENRMHAIKAIMAATLGDLFIPDLT